MHAAAGFQRAEALPQIMQAPWAPAQPACAGFHALSWGFSPRRNPLADPVGGFFGRHRRWVSIGEWLMEKSIGFNAPLPTCRSLFRGTKALSVCSVFSVVKIFQW